MVGLCGPFPKSLLEKGDEQLVKEAFDEGGNLKINKLGKVVGLEQRCASVDPKERSKFVAFIKRILVLDPEKRPRAKKLLKDEWLKHNYDEDVSPFEPVARKPVALKPVARKPVARKPVARKSAASRARPCTNVENVTERRIRPSKTHFKDQSKTLKPSPDR